MPDSTHRREFLATLAAAGTGLSLGGLAMPEAAGDPTISGAPLFKISVAEYSLHRLIDSGELDRDVAADLLGTRVNPDVLCVQWERPLP